MGYRRRKEQESERKTDQRSRNKEDYKEKENAREEKEHLEHQENEDRNRQTTRPSAALNNKNQLLPFAAQEPIQKEEREIADTQPLSRNTNLQLIKIALKTLIHLPRQPQSLETDVPSRCLLEVEKPTARRCNSFSSEDYKTGAAEMDGMDLYDDAEVNKL
ncbi:hypothetical protein DPMN_128389 [Dreissena polymorpha]|uniref:Uncharacterized protein n=1 Tax=Dreissena polymorpha TaxID=45954 RepID=A0A9D4H307_DREPO|nr:hypothetical protein DPMN_128389 [Dreissena polymorpha]